MKHPASEDDPDVGKLLRFEYVTEKLQCSRTVVYHLGRAGRLELVKFGRSRRVTERSLKKFLATLMSEPIDPSEAASIEQNEAP